MRLGFFGTNYTCRNDDVNAPSNGRNCLNFGLLGFRGFSKNKTRQTKHNVTLEPEILYLAYLALEVTSPAIVGLNAFLASPNLP